MAVCASLFVYRLHRQHARPASVHTCIGIDGCQLHVCFLVELALVHIGTVHHVVLIVHAHHPIRLTSEVVFGKVGTVLALVTRYLELSSLAIGHRILIVFDLRDVGATVVAFVHVIVVQAPRLPVPRVFSEPIRDPKLSLALPVHISIARLAVVRACKLHLLVLQLFLNELLRVAKLRQLNLFLLDDKGRQFPLEPLLVPLGLLLDFVDLVFGHQEANNLVQEIKFLGLLSHRVKQLFVFLRILLVNILQLVLGTLQLHLQLLDYFPAVLDFVLQ